MSVPPATTVAIPSRLLHGAQVPAGLRVEGAQPEALGALVDYLAGVPTGILRKAFFPRSFIGKGICSQG